MMALNFLFLVLGTLTTLFQPGIHPNRVYFQKYHHALNSSDALDAHLRDIPQFIHLIYIFEETTQLKDIENEITILIQNTNLEIRRHYKMDIAYSVAGYGYDDDGTNTRIYTNINGEVMFFYEYLESTVKSLKLSDTIKPTALNAIYYVIQNLSFYPNSFRIIHLISSSKTVTESIPMSFVTTLLQQYRITLHTLIKCAFQYKNTTVLGIDKRSAYTIKDAGTTPVTGDTDMRNSVIDCHDLLVIPAQWNNYGTIFDESIIRERSLLAKLAVVEIQAKLIAQNVGPTRIKTSNIKNLSANHDSRKIAALINGTHVITWDKYIYPTGRFSCKYLLAKDTSRSKAWSIFASHNSYGSLIVHIMYKEKYVQLGPGPTISLDNMPADLPVKLEGIHILRDLENIIVLTENDDLAIKYNYGTYLLLVSVSKKYFNEVAGIFGTNDNDPYNDLTTLNYKKHNKESLTKTSERNDGIVSLLRFMSFWKSNQQCLEKIEFQKLNSENSDSGLNRVSKMYLNLVQTYIKNHRELMSICNSNYIPKMLENIFKSVTLRDPYHYFCLLAWSFEEECKLKDVKIAIPKFCDHRAVNTKTMNEEPKEIDSVMVPAPRLADLPNFIYIVYIFEETTKLNDIKEEITKLIKITNTELRREHQLEIRYSVVGYGNSIDGDNTRFYTTDYGDVMFSLIYLESVINSLKLMPTTRATAIDAINYVIRGMPIHPTASRIMHLISASRTEWDFILPNDVQRLLSEYKITLHALIPCTITSESITVLGVDRNSAYTIEDSHAFPVVGDRELRKNIVACPDALFNLSQWNDYGSLFDENIVRDSHLLPMYAVINIQARLIAQRSMINRRYFDEKICVNCIQKEDEVINGNKYRKYNSNNSQNFQLLNL